jgi:bacterioferritin-associated ferredoxin
MSTKTSTASEETSEMAPQMSPQEAPKEAQRQPGQTICFCHNVTYEELQKAIAEGATTIELIRDRTCANTGCGGCEYDVTEVLAEELNKEELKEELAKVAAK